MSKNGPIFVETRDHTVHYQKIREITVHLNAMYLKFNKVLDYG